MLRLLITAVLVSQEVQSFFLATPQDSLLRGHVQGLWPGADKYQYNSQIEYQTPGFQHFSDHQHFYEQGSTNIQPNILPPPLQQQEPERQSEPLDQPSLHSQIMSQIYQIPQLPSREPVFSDVQTSPLYSSNLIQQGRMPFLSSYGVPQSGPTVENLQQPGRGTTETTIPIVVKLDNNQAVVVPVKAVYTLPPFLENLIQRIQSHYSVYNPVESFHLERPFGHPQMPSGLYESIEQLPPNVVSQDLKEPTTPASTSPVSAVSITTSTPSEPSTEQEATSSEQSTTSDSVTVLPPSSSAPLSSSSEESSEETSSESNVTPTISNEIASSTTTEAIIETTTAPPSSSSSTEVTPEASSQENVSTDLESEGYTYNRPSRAFLYPN